LYDIYIRVSRLGERDEDQATDAYEEKCRDWAARHDIIVDEVEKDTDISGSVKVADRKLERLVQKVEQGESEGIITPFLDRLGRDTIEGALAYRRIKLADGRLVCVEDGTDSDRPGDQLNFNIRMALAEDYLNRTRANYQSAVDRKVAKGAYIYKTPFGYRKDEEGRLVVYEADAKLVRELFERRTAGDDIGKLTRFLRDAGALQAHQGKDADGNKKPPKPFTKSGVRGLIANRCYLGEISVQHGKRGRPRIIKNYHAPLVTSQLFDTANAVKGAFHPRDHSLSGQVRLRGLVYCETCGKRTKVGGYTAKGQRLANYVCTTPGCEAHASMQARRLDNYVEHLLVQAAVAKDTHIAAVIEGDTRYQDALTAVENVQQLHDELRDDLDAQRTLGTKDWVAALKVRKDAVAVARQELSKVRPPNGPNGKGDADRRMSYDTFIEEYERESNAHFIEKVVIKPKPKGVSSKTIDPAVRLDVYFVGARAPYRPTFAKVSKRDQAIIDAHMAEAAAA
jgi:DNA invertase Pin-like site-specific DNA recombinase